MKKQFVTYPIALAVYELGFNEQCLGYYYHENGYTKTNPSVYHYGDFSLIDGYDIPVGSLYAPLWQQVIDWFREEHSTIIIINPYHDLDAVSEVDQILWDFTLWDKEWNDVSDYTYYHSYEEAREAAILEAIKIVKENKK